ncbi:MORC family CW-type zinc finger protein 3a isoform X2 [Sphaeramia orbicularis]|uniref:MORC family CW-type zinc finger protein 3a isoform X2 n=1 Tax=Sphaeramia orbicularis TaxID=375764 RepID=UPI00117FE5FE|nr:MORC family CW-type zinc finger protein 3 isoform X2 [Sphaeramia orbicularis]
MAAPTDRGVPLSTLCPKFLHTNSTSHTWPFSAIAELIDNAYDPDVSAKQFWIDKTFVNSQECLTFMDNGNGLEYKTMHKMLSFGYSDKIAVNGLEPIGIYGNGFKSGSMRLGKDAIVFSKSKTAQCVGMLSQTYLEEIGATQIIVPIVCLEQRDETIYVSEEHRASLQDILRYSPFKTEAALLTEVNTIGSSWSNGSTGTRIIIWNLRRTEDQLEFDFQRDRYDIRIPSDIYMALNDSSQHPERISSYVPETVYSLRAYCSILYLKPRMQIVIRGVKVKSQLVAKNLAYIRKDHYKPNFLNKRIPIIFGYNTKSKDHYGIMMYHKNRLIKAYERVGCQLKANNKGVGVIGVIECNFLDPTHNKQSFIETDKYRKTMNNLGIKLEEYWNEIRYRRSTENPHSIPVEDDIKRPDQNWVQCDDCLQWRKLPDGIDVSKLPDKWFCHFNPDPQFRSCKVEQEAEDSDDDLPSYSKTYKKQEREDKRKAERMRAQEVRWQQGGRRLQPHQSTVCSPSTPTTPRSGFNRNSVQGGAARAESSALSSSTISQAACSPSSSDGLPIISNVCSLRIDPQRVKRPQPVTPQSTPKRPRVSWLSRDISNASSVDVSPVSTASVPLDSDDDTDDDLFIVESGSTLKPKQTGFSLAKVKQEPTQNETAVNLLLECSDDAAVDPPSETNKAGTSSSGTANVRTSPLTVCSTTTQTEVRGKIKEEKDDGGKAGQSLDKNQTVGEERVVAGTSSDVGTVCDIKEENHSATQSEKQTFQNGAPQRQDNDEDFVHSRADPSPSLLQHPTVSEIQQQQDQLLELMQATAQERDSLKEQVNQLSSQLQETQSKLQELSEINVKKEASHQHTQTEETQDGKDYKSLFEKARQKVNDLIKDKVDLLAAAEAKPSTVQGEEKDIEEISLQVGCLLQELEQRNKERDELRSQLDGLEEERANLASKCEELTLRLQQQRENTGEGSRAQHQANDSSAPTDPEEAGGSADSGPASSSDACRSLVELRHNVGRLLVTYMPALELDQVNYDCNVIDEILEQYLNSHEQPAV